MYFVYVFRCFPIVLEENSKYIVTLGLATPWSCDAKFFALLRARATVAKKGLSCSGLRLRQSA